MTVTDAAPLELLTIGRISVDLYAEQLDRPLERVESFRKSIGGTATNVAVAAARLGRRSAVFTRVGDDPMGRYVRDALATTFGVEVRFVGIDPVLRTPLAFATVEDRSSPVLDFYRAPAAPDMQIRSADIDPVVVSEVPILWFPAATLSAEPSRSTVHQMLAWRDRKTHTVIDLDWRPVLWTGPEHARRAIDEVLDQVTVAVGNRQECAVATGHSSPDHAADALLARGVQAVIVKLGEDGVLLATADGARVRVPPHPIDVVCGLGAGDAFGGALCHGLLSGWSLDECCRIANVAGAVVASRLMCADDMPTLADILSPATEHHHGNA